MSDEITYEASKLIVKDLTAFFNAILAENKKESFDHRPRRQALKEIFADLARLVDFHAGSQLAINVVRANSLGIAEVSAIEAVRYIKNNLQAISVLYKVMDEVSKTRNIAFTPAYKP